jgi:hypothetical protein
MKKIIPQNFSLLSPVSLTHSFAIMYLRKFSRKIRNDPYEKLRGPGDMIYEKNMKSKISCQTPFKSEAKYCRFLTVFRMRRARERESDPDTNHIEGAVNGQQWLNFGLVTVYTSPRVQGVSITPPPPHTHPPTYSSINLGQNMTSVNHCANQRSTVHT